MAPMIQRAQMLTNVQNNRIFFPLFFSLLFLFGIFFHSIIWLIYWHFIKMEDVYNMEKKRSQIPQRRYARYAAEGINKILLTTEKKGTCHASAITFLLINATDAMSVILHNLHIWRNGKFLNLVLFLLVVAFPVDSICDAMTKKKNLDHNECVLNFDCSALTRN